ncbi:serine hydrolase [Actinomadura oligospora]|uniref:serine hydrolase n=1 Tax=Actinomadura oligospora TaxID=111804 RepID=UPI0004B0E045|nr:serine hydrolase [Actinomadura oligospora]
MPINARTRATTASRKPVTSHEQVTALSASRKRATALSVSRTRAVAVAVVLLSGVTACSGSKGRDATDAAPAAGRQLDWIVSASRHLPISDADAKEHIASSALTAFGGTAGLSKELSRIGPLTAQFPPTSGRTRAAGWFTAGHGVSVFGMFSTDRAGRIAGLYFAKQPDSWRDLDARLREIAPEVSFATAEIGKKGRCRVVHGVNATTQRPLGSAFKLYVLGALSDAVARQEVAWDTPLPINDAWKSLPSGTFQNKPAGTTMTLAQYADAMISNSDNTAADHLIHRLGREAVEREVGALGNRRQDADRPFLTTREVFTLKGSGYPARAKRYLALPAKKRAATLPALNSTPLSGVTAWQHPRDIGTIEWFASPTDVCAAFKGLNDRTAVPGQANVGHALSLYDGGIGLDPKAYPTVWFKGGGEPGVLTANYLTKTSGGRTFVTSVMLSDPKNAFPVNAELNMLAVARAGIQLAGS